MNDKGTDTIKWRIFQCPYHSAWLIPTRNPFPHWKCFISGCTFIRAAKLRTWTERKIFREAAYTDGEKTN
jgi:hypothetical protein